MLGKKMTKALSFLLAAIMVFGMIGPVKGYAAEDENLEPAFTWEAVDEEVGTDAEIAAEEVSEIEPDFAEDENVRVLIVMEEDSVLEAGFDVADLATNSLAADYSEMLEQNQNQVVEKIEEEVMDGVALDTVSNFTILANAVSANVAYGKIEEIKGVVGVADVVIETVYEIQADAEPNTMTAGEMVGSYNTWSIGYTGAGMRIAIIDTGLDTDHPSFSGDAFMYALEEQAAKEGVSIDSYNLLATDEINSVIKNLHAYEDIKGFATGEDFYLNAKVPYAFNYVDTDFDVTHDNDNQGDHGSHVAGIATANRYVETENGFEAQSLGVVGIAPEAQLLVMKVFGKGGGAYTADYMNAIEDAIILGADTINLSLGSAAAGTTTHSMNYINEIMDALTATNTVVSMSAGNSGAFADASQLGANLVLDVNVDTVGSPGSYTNSFTVASAINSGYTNYALGFKDFLSFYLESTAYSNVSITTLDKTGKGTEYDYVFIEGFGKPEDFENLDVTGKIVLVSRGDTSFFEKHMAAAEAGAAGCIVYNNQPGRIGLNLTGSNATIPCVSITLDDANIIKTLSDKDEQSGVYTGKVSISANRRTDHNAADGYLMSDFSSWGVPGTLELKPEITAPGENIYSTLNNGEYGLMSGTSMAAPSIAGLSALVLQYIQENNLASKTNITERALAQSLLMSTATPLTQADGNIYSPRKQGAGLANAAAAVTSQTYILVGDEEGNDGKVKVELGDDPFRTGEYSFDFTVYNLSGKKAFYTLDSQLLTESVKSGILIANSSYNLDSKIEYTVDSTQLMYDVNQDGRVNRRDAAELLKYVNGSRKSDLVDACADEFDFNGNGVVDTDDVTKLMKAIETANWWWKKPSLNLNTKVFTVKDQATVHATIKLSDADREYIDNNFPNGMYVEGYAMLEGSVDLSIPVLAFYGNWTDSSMYEPYDFMEEYMTGYTWPTYSGEEKTNFLTYKYAGVSGAYYYVSNMYEEEDAYDTEYIEDRNAISSLSGDSIDKLYFTLIRNAAKLHIAITDAVTGVEYYSMTQNDVTAAYYSVTDDKWHQTLLSATLGWKGTDAEGKPLADGTKVVISVTALPEYYNDESKIPGEGVTLAWPMTIDNTAPVATADLFSLAGTTFKINVTDDRYVAMVKVYDYDKTTLLGSYAVNQTELGATTEIDVDFFNTLFYVQVIDYAGNKSVYRVNNSGVADTKIADSIELSAESIRLLKNNTVKLTADVGPMTLVDTSVIWSSADESVAKVDANGTVYGIGDGTTTITATTVAFDKDGNHLTAECEVEVFTVDVDLNAVLWDELGSVYFVDFNTSTLPSYSRMFEEELDAPLWAMTDTYQEDGYFYGSAYSAEEASALLYLVDISGDSPDYCDWMASGDSTYWNTDLASGVTTEGFYGTYGPFIMRNDFGDDYMLELKGAYDLSEYTDGAALTGIAYAGYGYSNRYRVYVDFFYAIDENGGLYTFNVYGGLGVVIDKAGDTGISTNGQYSFSSLYYEFGENAFFYSVYDGSDNISLYKFATDFNEDGEEFVSDVLLIGQFGDKVWPVSGLFQYDRASAEDIEEAGALRALNEKENVTFENVYTGEIDKEAIDAKLLKDLPTFNKPVKDETPVVEEEIVEEEAPVEDAEEAETTEEAEDVAEEAEEAAEEVEETEEAVEAAEEAEDAAEEAEETEEAEVTEEAVEEAEEAVEETEEAVEETEEEVEVTEKAVEETEETVEETEETAEEEAPAEEPATEAEESDESSSGSGNWFDELFNGFWRWLF